VGVGVDVEVTVGVGVVVDVGVTVGVTDDVGDGLTPGVCDGVGVTVEVGVGDGDTTGVVVCGCTDITVLHTGSFFGLLVESLDGLLVLLT